MRLPFLQMESDLLAHGAAEVAHLAGCSVPLALGHIAMIRAWAVSFADDSAPPDGWVAGEAAGRRVEAAAQWTGERGRLLQALMDAGHIRSENGGIRVLHLEPYAKAWEQNRTSKERMRKLRERSANTDARSAKFGGQTQTQTQKEEDPPPPPSAATRDELRLDAQEKPRKRAKSEKAPDPRHKPLSDALVAAGWPHHGGRTAKAVSELLALGSQCVGDEDARFEVSRRAAIARAHEGFPRVRELHELVTHWGHFERPAVRHGEGFLGAPGPEERPPCFGCGADEEGATYGEPEVYLGYGCGCAVAWVNTRADYHEAAAWAENRRKNAA